MKKQLSTLTILLVLTSFLIGACGALPSSGGDQAEPTAIPVVKADSRVVVEGRIVPNETVTLAYTTGGEIAEVLVEEGDLVKVGDVLARLGDREPLEANIVNAETELLNAQQALDKLEEQAGLAATEALRRIALATRALRDAQYKKDNYIVPSTQENFEPMEATVIFKEKLDEAQAVFDRYKRRSSSDPQREDAKEALDDAQSDYNTAVRRLEYEVAVDAAQDDLEKAIEDYDIYSAGPKPEDIKAAEARIAAAEANLAAAQSALNNLELIATIDGTIVDLNLTEGEQVSPGTPVVQITDFSTWYVETDNLTEIEVVEISLGQGAEIVPDALPDLTLRGVVDKINDQYEEKRGDVTYTVRIKLDESDPRLRWGMTVIVTFDES